MGTPAGKGETSPSEEEKSRKFIAASQLSDLIATGNGSGSSNN